MSVVEGLPVALAWLAHRPRERVALGRRQQQVRVIVHEHVGVDGDAVLHRDVEEQLAEVLAVGVVNENCATIDATLGDMERDIGNVESRLAWHDASLAAPDASPSSPGTGCLVGRLPGLASVNYLRPLFLHAGGLGVFFEPQLSDP